MVNVYRTDAQILSPQLCVPCQSGQGYSVFWKGVSGFLRDLKNDQKSFCLELDCKRFQPLQALSPHFTLACPVYANKKILAFWFYLL